jgi:rubrerythrin
MNVSTKPLRRRCGFADSTHFSELQMADGASLIKIFEYALNQEQTGMSFFQTSIDRMGVGAAVSAFSRLIEEERRHIAFIEKLLADLRAEGAVTAATVASEILEPTNFFDERANKEFLEQCVQGSMVPDVTVFNTAWLIEKDLSEFYGRMAEKTDGGAKDALLMLANWEKEHERFFRRFRDKLAEVYAYMPWGG